MTEHFIPTTENDNNWSWTTVIFHIYSCIDAAIFADTLSQIEMQLTVFQTSFWNQTISTGFCSSQFDVYASVDVWQLASRINCNIITASSSDTINKFENNLPSNTFQCRQFVLLFIIFIESERKLSFSVFTHCPSATATNMKINKSKNVCSQWMNEGEGTEYIQCDFMFLQWVRVHDTMSKCHCWPFTRLAWSALWNASTVPITIPQANIHQNRKEKNIR